VKTYLDTGVFVDYLIYRGHAEFFLRTRGRRNRTVQQLSEDVSKCLNKIANKHEGFTSSLTLYEVEESLYSKLLKSSKGIEDRRRYIIISSRSLIIQMIAIMYYYNLQMLNLSEDIIRRQVQEIELQIRGIRAADSLHMATAILNNAEILITTDRHLLGLNNVFQNQNGIEIQCLDTNDAKRLL
jgi:predicted nucleic acid-binding protein